jgi:hypothetical protein
LKKDVLAESIYAVGIEDAIMGKKIEQHPGKLGNRSRGTSTCAMR